MRLDKFISNNTDISRADVRRRVKAGSVTVNGSVATTPAAQVAEADVIELDNHPVHELGQRYYMLHKPAGYVCANRDSHLPTVLDLFAEAWSSRANPSALLRDLQIAGRLDVDTTGLVIVTSDGQWNHRLTSPQSGCGKRYLVALADGFDQQTERLFTNGMLLEGEKRPTRPAHIEQLDDYHLLLTLYEGKYHQVKRMFAATGNRVTSLHRLAIGSIELDRALAPGEFRPLMPEEIASIHATETACATPSSR